MRKSLTISLNSMLINICNLYQEIIKNQGELIDIIISDTGSNLNITTLAAIEEARKMNQERLIAVQQLVDDMTTLYYLDTESKTFH